MPVVGNVAALTDHKDHATLVEAMALLRPRSPEARFVIVGEGELRPALEGLARERGASDRVVFAGFRTDLDRLLPAFDVFCLSSRLEGLGTSLLDAMAFARPVVATAAGGIPEAVEDGVTGRLVRRRGTRRRWPTRSGACSPTRPGAPRWVPRGGGASSTASRADHMVDDDAAPCWRSCA